MALLHVDDLDAGYGDLQILEGVDLGVGDEEYVTIVGPNGAGKSTVMKSIFGLTTFMGGTITFDEEEISDLDPSRSSGPGSATFHRATTCSRPCR